MRELQNAIERAVALTRYHEIVPTDLPERAASRAPAPNDVQLVSVNEVERRHCIAVLEAVQPEARRIRPRPRSKDAVPQLIAWGVEPGRAS